MKKKSYLLAAIVVLFSFANAKVHAQLLKKLKDKVNNEPDKTAGGPNAKITNTSTASGTNNANTKINFALYNVITQPMYNAGDIKEKVHDFEQGYCSYENGSTAFVKGIIATQTASSMYKQAPNAYTPTVIGGMMHFEGSFNPTGGSSFQANNEATIGPLHGIVKITIEKLQ